jgi:hypothetical protein
MTRWDRWRGRGTSRRAFLGGAAAAITLPWLPSLGARAEGEPPVRLLWWYVPNGIHMPAWRPSVVGAGYDLPTILEPLGSMSSEVSVLSGLTNMGGWDERPGDHARGTAAFLTCMRPLYEGVVAGISVDQVAAQANGSRTVYPSLQLGTESGGAVGTCDSGYSCAYTRNISWAGPSSPLPKQTSPQAVFDRLFGGFDAGLTEAQRQRREQYRSSVLDHVVGDANTLRGRISADDRLRLDEYLTGVRELEQRLAAGSGSCEPFARPRAPHDIEEHIDSLTELTVLTLQCDLTRYVTFMLGNAGSNRNYGFIGAAGAHHEISHHQSRQDNFDKLVTIGRWEVERFAHLVRRLSETSDGSLLDQSLVVFGSEISDGDRHNHDDLPVLLAGRGGGAATPGRHVVYDDRPISDVYMAMLEAVDVSVDSFGLDGTEAADLHA